MQHRSNTDTDTDTDMTALGYCTNDTESFLILEILLISNDRVFGMYRYRYKVLNAVP